MNRVSISEIEPEAYEPVTIPVKDIEKMIKTNTWEDSLEQEEIMYNLKNNLYSEDYTKKIKELFNKYKKQPMGRKLFVFTKKESISSYATNFMLNTWYDVTKELKEGHDDVYTTQILALAGAQELFEEIYVDNEIIWPNEKQHITNKELRPAHNLAKLVGCWYRYTKEGRPL